MDHYINEENSIKGLFSKILKVPVSEISENLDPDKIGTWDSLNHLTLISSFEEEFSIDIEPEEMIAMYQNYKVFKSIILRKLLSEK
tara:strand:+ start:30 stop:287 length:258 start_codon:yes stop_codon:yes gene_type:complete